MSVEGPQKPALAVTSVTEPQKPILAVTSVTEPQKPAFLQCCLVCNAPVPAPPAETERRPPRDAAGSDLRHLLAAHVSPAARDELAIVEAVCAACLACLQQWSAARQTARRLHQSLAGRYRAARQRRAACLLSLHLPRLVVQIPYGAFLLNARGLPEQLAWPELVRRVADAVLQSAGIERPSPADPPPPPPPPVAAATRTVGCQTPAGQPPPVALLAAGAQGVVQTGSGTWPASAAPAVAGMKSQLVQSGPGPQTAEVPAERELKVQEKVQARPATARRLRGRPPRSATQPPRLARHRQEKQSEQQQQQEEGSRQQQKQQPDQHRDQQPPQPGQQPEPPRQPPEPLPPLLGCLRGWEGITNVQPSAPPRPPAGAQKRVGFEGVKEQAEVAWARDLEETLSVLSVADTASLLDRTETLSVLSDTAELSTLADENWPSLELEPDIKPRQPEGAPSVSFAEPSSDGPRPARRSLDRGEDLLREFAETMSNISEGVVLEDLEGYFEEIDRPGPPRPPSAAAEPPPPAAAVPDAATPAPAAAAQCPVCQKVFRHQRYLRPHLRLHDGSLYRCQHCDAPFLHQYKLQLHLRRRHGVAPRPGQTAAAAAAPAQRRDSAGKLACADCGRRFSHATTLRQHQRLHRGGGYRCEQCDRLFPSRSELARHADTHRAEKLYKCEVCGRAFQISSSLARHRTVHTERAASCDLCGKGFDRRDTMLKHRETHRAENQHACHLCGKKYKQRRILMKHVKLIHGGREHVCQVCQKAFRTRYELVKHAQRRHEKASATPPLESLAKPEPA